MWLNIQNFSKNGRYFRAIAFPSLQPIFVFKDAARRDGTPTACAGARTAV
jgi:hypothetical protein